LFSGAFSGCENASDTRPRRLGNRALTAVPCLLARRDRRQFDLRMLRQQPQQLDARVARASDDACLDHLRL
jgi:hypothetical protein